MMWLDFLHGSSAWWFSVFSIFSLPQEHWAQPSFLIDKPSLLNSVAVSAQSYLSGNMLQSVSYLLIYTFLSNATKEALLSNTVR